MAAGRIGGNHKTSGRRERERASIGWSQYQCGGMSFLVSDEEVASLVGKGRIRLWIG